MPFAVRIAAIVAAVLCLASVARAAEGDWHDDAPGKVHHLSPHDLPAPYATKSTAHMASISRRPVGAVPKAPPGFTVRLFTDKLKAPRLMRVAPNGDIFVAETREGRISVLRAGGDGSRAPAISTFAAGLDGPFGIAFYPPGPEPQFVYVGNPDSVVRFPYRNGDLKARGAAEILIHDLWSSGGGHTTRDLAFSNDGKRMFVSVGSSSNAAADMSIKSPEAARAFQADHALGAAWDDEANRADVLSFDPDGKNLRVFATGIRNCVTMPMAADGTIWCIVNERDGLGDNLPPDYATSVKEGAFYGWPWFYIGDHPDPRLDNARPDLAGHVTVPDVLIQPHSAPLQGAFYNGAMFPELRGSLFVALHGSWNRATRTGYKLVRVIFKDGKPTGAYEDFLTGFVLGEREIWGRPVGVAVDRTGALLVGEDGGSTIWRVTKTE